MPSKIPAPTTPPSAADHAAGVKPETVSPSERALAPEGDEPMQSANAIADDGTYVGQAGGYMGAPLPAVESGTAEVDASNERGDGAYGFPAGPGVGMPGGEHQPAGAEAGRGAEPLSRALRAARSRRKTARR